MLYSHCTQNCIFWFIWRLKTLVLWQKIVQNFLVNAQMYLFCPKNSTINSRKTSIIQEWLVVESCPNPSRIPVLMLYRLMENKSSHFKELILAEVLIVSIIIDDFNARSKTWCSGDKTTREGKNLNVWFPNVDLNRSLVIQLIF